MNYGSIARRIAPSHRCEGLSFMHHEHVASFPPAQQCEWLKRAVKEEWSSRQMKSAIAADTPAVSAETDETVRLSGGQAIDVEKLSPAAQAQIAEALTDTAGEPEPKEHKVSAEERKAMESRAGGTFLTDEEFKALTADELRDLIGKIFFGNSDIESFDEFMEMTADELRHEVGHEGIFSGAFYGVMRDNDGDLYLYYD
jgi:hypothetical protein